MLPIRGTVICSLSGRDENSFMVVLGQENGFVLVCDGKHHPIERPKKKNIKHISATLTVLSDEQILTNRSIRHALNDFKAQLQRRDLNVQRGYDRIGRNCH